MGRLDDVRAQAAEVVRIDPNFSLVRMAKTMRYKNPADIDRGMDSLRKVGLK
jgi:hypothetical protein